MSEEITVSVKYPNRKIRQFQNIFSDWCHLKESEQSVSIKAQTDTKNP